MGISASWDGVGPWNSERNDGALDVLASRPGTRLSRNRAEAHHVSQPTSRAARPESTASHHCTPVMLPLMSSNYMRLQPSASPARQPRRRPPSPALHRGATSPSHSRPTMTPASAIRPKDFPGTRRKELFSTSRPETRPPSADPSFLWSSQLPTSAAQDRWRR